MAEKGKKTRNKIKGAGGRGNDMQEEEVKKEIGEKIKNAQKK